ncbi:MAG: Transcriptional regulator AbrB [Rhodospirillales bacterium]|nr:Transcriptional regulator AbrB [Rhodospirillales bacterium]
MTILTGTAKWQVTLRKAILKHLGIHSGEKIAVDMQPDSRSRSKPPERPAGFRTSLIS